MKTLRTTMPEISKEIPCPFTKNPRTYVKRKSLWHEFLRELKPSDSFLIMEHEYQNVTHIARQLQIALSARHGPNEELKVPTGQVRLWQVPDPQPGEVFEHPSPYRQPRKPKAAAALNLL